MTPTSYDYVWKLIATARKLLAGGRCEHCGHSHDTVTGYMLGVHHRDHDCRNNHPDNLIALCQRCHLRVQGRRQMHVKNQLQLFETSR